MSARSLPSVVAGLAVAAVSASAFAQTDNELHGRLEVQDAGQFSTPGSIEAAFGEQTADDALANLRLTWQPTWGAWSLQAHYVVSVDDGPDVTLARAESGLIAIPPPTMFDLTDNFVDRGRVLASQTVDRLAVAYTTPDWVVRVG